MLNPIVEAQEIRKTFYNGEKQKLEILKGVSLAVFESEITVIIGASGAGKSTLLHILSGLDNADSGIVKIKETEITKLNDEKLSSFRNKNIGFVFQFHHLLPEFDARENVALPLMINGLSHSKAIQRAEELLSVVGLNDRANHKPAELSGGEQQRVAVARALANNPPIIFADEPTGNLDSQNSELLHKLFVDLKQKLGIALLIVTHNPELVKLGEKIFEMKDGLIHKKK
ncbi:MAG: ABC transporter ATP-binding protein [Ignavibacteriales bacterium]|nr:ABC transporter ATP-binding protein [Ignavibacteriales bacterium]